MKICAIFALILTLPVVGLHAQNFPFPTADAEWVTTHVSNYCIGGSNIYFLWREYLGPEVTIQNKTYHQVLFQPECEHATTGTHCTGFDRYFTGGPRAVGAVREENGRVYFYKYDLPDSLFSVYESTLKDVPAATDVLLFDFTLNTGDTLVVTRKSGNAWRFLTTLVDTLPSGRREVSLKRLNGIAYTRTLQSGIGSSFGLFGLYYDPSASSYLPLGTCFYHKGVKLVSSQWCGVCGIVDAPEIAGVNPLKCYPNPATDLLHIEADPAQGPYALRVFDGLGRLLYTDPGFAGKTALGTAGIAGSGWLHITLTAASGRVWSGRVVVER